MAKAKRAAGGQSAVDDGDAGAAKGRSGRSSASLIALAVAAIFLVWFALANLNKVKINFWIYDRSEPLILVILIAGLLGALIGALLMRQRTRGSSKEE